MQHGGELRGHLVSKGRFHEPGRFGRMFPHLRSLKAHQLQITPEALGGVTGPMDGGSAPDPSQNNRRLTAGFTFLGQFLDHDITFDPTSSLEQQNDPEAIQNFRTPAFELDSVYGSGPSSQPYLYDTDGKHVLLSADGVDVPRNANHVAIIGDPRNDENLIVSQLHRAFMKFHNAVLDQHAGGDFEEAQRLVRWHYQYMVLHEFLPLTCGDDLVDRVVGSGRRFYRFADEPYMPVEFSVAAYRFGHSQVRPGYRVNANFAAPLFPATPDEALNGQDLRGRQPVTAARAVDWRQFFGQGAQPGRLIDRRLSTPLLNLPDTVVGPGAPPARRSLAIRNIQRGFTFALPAGQTVARAMGADVVPDTDLWKNVPGGAGLAPLWYYVLAEAESLTGGEHLAGIGARIVAEVFVGLLQGDKASYLNHEPRWTPTLPRANPKEFTMVDLLTVAGAF
jgi:hypothetical protein